MILIQAIRNAMVNDIVVRNVADLAAVPTGKPGRPGRTTSVSGTSLGGPMHATDVRTEFKRITGKAGPGQDWTPRELRHTFISLLSDSGVPVPQPSRWARCSTAEVRRQRKDKRRPKLTS